MINNTYYLLGVIYNNKLRLSILSDYLKGINCGARLASLRLTLSDYLRTVYYGPHKGD